MAGPSIVSFWTKVFRAASDIGFHLARVTNAHSHDRTVAGERYKGNRKADRLARLGAGLRPKDEGFHDRVKRSATPRQA